MIWLFLALAGGLGAVCRASLDTFILARLDRAGRPHEAAKGAAPGGSTSAPAINAASESALVPASAPSRTPATPSARRPLPWGILVVNVLGAFLLGLAAAALRPASPQLYAVLGTGFLGGFTTFSTAMLDVWSLARQRRTWAALGFLVGTAVASVLVALAGLALGAQIG